MLIELKGNINEYSSARQAYFEDALVDLLRNYNYLSRNIALESYNFDFLLRIKEKIDLPIIALINKNGNVDKAIKSNLFDGYSLEYPVISSEVLGQIIGNKKVLYSWDDKRPLDHYYFLKGLLQRYKMLIQNGQLDLTVISEFPTKAKQYILTK